MSKTFEDPDLELEHILSWLYKEGKKSATEPLNYTKYSRQICLAIEQVRAVLANPNPLKENKHE